KRDGGAQDAAARAGGRTELREGADPAAHPPPGAGDAPKRSGEQEAMSRDARQTAPRAGGVVRQWVRAAAVMAYAAALAAPAALAGQDARQMTRYFGDPNEYYTPPAFHGNAKYDGRFTFARIMYRGYAHFTDEGPGWSHDYPRSDVHL